MRTPRFVAVTALLSLLGVVSTGLVGCGGTNAPAVTTPAGPAAKNLFEYDYGDTINEFSLSASGTATATATMAMPSNFVFYNLAQDASGKVYLCGFTQSTNTPIIMIFAAEATSFTTPVATINPAAEVDYMAVDSAGNIYASDGGDTYYEYSPTGSLLRTLTEPSFTSGTDAIAVDTSGNLYILGYTASLNNQIEEVSASAPSGNITPTRTLTFSGVPGVSFPASIAVDATGNLYVGIEGASYTGASSIEVFNATATVTNPTRTLTIPSQPTGFYQEINDVAVDSAGYVYTQVEDYNPPSNNVITNPFYGFAPGATTPAVNFNVSGNPYGYFYIR
jgi:sugar lactone lactonase YvrE